MPFSTLESLIPMKFAEGVHLRIMHGERVMMSFVSLDPGGIVPEHSHPHEQMGMGVEGAFELAIEGEARVIRRGDVYLIPSNVRHSARGLNGPAVALDIFSPVREDYADQLRQLLEAQEGSSDA